MAVAVERAVAVLLVVAAALNQVSHAAVYKVGDSAGWTTIGHVDYKKWAATKTFQLGDIILFEYHPQFHNVMRVTHAEYKSCNTSVPISTFTTGNDSYTVSTRGHHYFLCGTPGHCQSGQKVDINVIRASSPNPAPSGSPSASTPASPATVSVKAPAPSSNVSASMHALRRLPCNLGLAVTVFVALVFGFA